MDSGLIINLVLAAISVAFLIQLLTQRKQFKAELSHHQEQIKNELDKRAELDLKYQNEINLLKNEKKSEQESQKITLPPQPHPDSKATLDALLLNLENLRKEKDQELAFRLEAEKQIDLALNKTTEVQKRIEDWRLLQEANLQDAYDSMMQVGEDLYSRLIESYRAEGEAIKNQIDNTAKNIYEHLDKIINQGSHTNINNDDNSVAIGVDLSGIDQYSRNLEDLLKSAQLQPNVSYFMQHSLPEEIKKSVLCEALVVFSKDKIMIIDSKSLKFFLELASNRSKNIADADNVFVQKIERYLAYLTNPKYQSNIINYFAKNQIIVADAKVDLVMLAPTEREVGEFKKLDQKYQQILKDNNISLHSLRSLSNVVLNK